LKRLPGNPDLKGSSMVEKLTSKIQKRKRSAISYWIGTSWGSRSNISDITGIAIQINPPSKRMRFCLYNVSHTPLIGIWTVKVLP